VIGVVGILLPMAWDFYNSTAAIELQLEQFAVLLGRSTGIPELSVVYKGQELQQISKASFVLVNTGRKALTYREIIEAPIIRFQRDSEVIDAWIDSTFPNNLQASIKMKDSHSVQLEFTLLNPGDYIRFVVLTDASSPVFTAEARLVGVKNLRVVNKVPSIKAAKRSTPLSVYVVGVFTAFGWLVVLAAISDGVKEVRFKREIRSGKLKLPEAPQKDVYLSFIQRKLSWTTDNERKGLIEMVTSIPEEKLGEEEQQKLIISKMVEVAETATSNLVVGPVFLIIATLGTWYVLTQIR